MEFEHDSTTKQSNSVVSELGLADEEINDGLRDGEKFFKSKTEEKIEFEKFEIDKSFSVKTEICLFVESGMERNFEPRVNRVNLTLKMAAELILNILKLVSVSSLSELTTTTAATHTVRIIPGTAPIKQKEKRIAYQYQDEFDKILDDLLASKKVRPSYSAWASPLRLLRKKDGSLRVTVDYQQVNNVTEKVAYPLPFIDEIFNRLSKAKYFTVMDLTSGYYQVPLDPNSRQYTAFICSRGLFEYLVLPMGITNATETFQRMMNKVLDGLLHVICEVYLDDIIVYSDT
jgi:hypothetical protein